MLRMSPANSELKFERSPAVVRVNTSITGEPAEIVLDLKRRRIVRSTVDAMVQGIYALHKSVLERDLALAKLKALAERNSSSNQE
jgi:hypothetical protein